MDEKLVGLILALAVGVVMTGALLAPVVASYGYEESTYYNEGAFFAAVDDDTHTIVVDSTAITVDGDEIDQSLFPSGFTQYTIVYADAGFIRLDDYNVVVRNVYSGNIVDYTFTDETVTITIDGDAATITTTDDDASSTSLSSVNFYVAAAGDFVLSTTPVVNSDSEIYGAGQTTYTTDADLPTSLNVYAVWSGDMDAVTATIVNYTSASDWSACVVSDTTVNTTALDNDLYRIDSVVLDYTATYTSTSTDYDVTATYTYFLAPYAVSYDNPNYIGFGVSGLMTAIVVVILVAMIAAAAAAAGRERDL